MLIDWLEFKKFVSERNSDILEIEKDGNYYLYAQDGNLNLECVLDKNPSDTTDLVDFETNYLPICNPRRVRFDSTGRPFARFAIASEGFVFKCLAIKFTTASLGSLHCKNPDFSDVTFITYKMFDANGQQTLVDLQATITQIDIEPPYDFEIVGGRIWQKEVPLLPVYGHMIGVPDIPEEYGGNKRLCDGGLDFQFVDKTYGIDGRAPKMLYYNPEQHSNKIRVVFHHTAGFKHDFMFSLEHYK